MDIKSEEIQTQRMRHEIEPQLTEFSNKMKKEVLEQVKQNYLCLEDTDNFVNDEQRLLFCIARAIMEELDEIVDLNKLRVGIK